MTSRKGSLIVIEGIDGAGKSTLMQNLGDRLKNLVPEVVLTKEPGGSALGMHLRDLLQYQSVCLAPKAEYMLFAADRAQHFHDLIIPAIKRGALIISDRMGDSSIAYQGYGRGHDIDFIKRVNSWTMDGIVPDITIYLKISLTDALERMAVRGGKPTVYEKEKQSFLERVKKGFDTLYKNRTDVLVIDAMQNEEMCTSQALEYVKTWLQIKN